MAVRIYVTDNAVQPGIVRPYRTIQIYSERFSYIRSVVSSINLRLCRQPLRLDVQAEVAKLIVALIADGEVKFIARADFEPPAVMVVAGRQSSNDIHRVRESVIHRIVMQAHDLAIEIPVRACWIGHVWVRSFLLVNIRVCDVDIIVARALQQFRVQCHTQKSVLTAWGGNLADGDRYAAFPSSRVDARHALPGTLGDPKHIVRSPGDFPRPLKAGDEDLLLELFGSSHDRVRTVLSGKRAKERHAHEHAAYPRKRSHRALTGTWKKQR